MMVRLDFNWPPAAPKFTIVGFQNWWGGYMPTLAEVYEYQAEECLRAAAKADDPKQRALMLKLASAWREDAEALKRGQELQPASFPRKAKALRRGAEGTPREAPAPIQLRRTG